MDNKQSRICVIGYFEHSNTGDEQYKLTFNYFLNKYLPNTFTIEYINCDKLLLYKFQESDIIILGGGDVLNNYFLDQLIIKFNGKSNKILAVSVGMPYTTILDTNKLNIIDYIFIRTKQDLSLFENSKVFYMSDMSRYIQEITEITKNKETINEYKKIIKKLKHIKKSGKKIISFSLNRHIYNVNNTENYDKIILSFVRFIEYLLKYDYHVIFIPYNTNTLDDENDILIHNDIYNMIDYTECVTNVDFTLSSSEILEIYDHVYINIPMRYHSCLYSIYKNVIMLPIFTTRKIKNLLLDINWNDKYELHTNTNDIPLFMDYYLLINKFNNLICHNNLVEKLDNINNLIKNNTDGIDIFINIIETDYIKIKNVKSKEEIINMKIDNLYNTLQKIALNNNYNDFRDIPATNINLQKLIVNIISYHITNKIDYKYNYGLMQKVFYTCFDFYKEITWIFLDYKTPVKIYNQIGLFNINYIDQNDYSGAHRSGWQYVYQNIKFMNSDSVKIKNKIVPYLDLYVDRTFHWNKDINKTLKLIPYKNDWYGFIHHTFDESFSEYNNYNLLKNPYFIESLKVCKGLFVLSKYLHDKFKVEFDKLKIKVNIYTLTHPTETPSDIFTFDKYIFNTDKKIIHVGGWLRNIFTFYNLELSNTNLRKVALKGVNMNNYYPDKNFTNDLLLFLTNEQSSNDPTQNASQNASQNTSQNASQNVYNSQGVVNNWYKHYYEYTKDIIKSVSFIELLSNDDYDKLLTENIIFLNLVDASAVNTIIECKVRNTPIIVNKHPAVVEILGEDYPLYYNDGSYYEINTQVSMLANTENIHKAYIYLKNLDKTNLEISYFIKQFTEILTLN